MFVGWWVVVVVLFSGQTGTNRTFIHKAQFGRTKRERRISFEGSVTAGIRCRADPNLWPEFGSLGCCVLKGGVVVGLLLFTNIHFHFWGPPLHPHDTDLFHHKK